MKNTRSLGKVGAGVAAISLGLLGVGVTATPAIASPVDPNEYDVTSSSVIWQDIDEIDGAVGDAEPFNSTTGIYGWTNDAYDDLPEPFVISDGDNTWDFVATDVIRNISEGGTSSFIFTANTGAAFAVDYTVTETLTLQGNYARWAYVITGGDTSGLTVTFDANLGSDDNSLFVEDGNTLVSNDGGTVDPEDQWQDPVLGFSVTTDGTFNGFGVVDGEDALRPSASGASTFTLTSVVLDYNPASGQFATDFAKSLVPTLDTTFGAVYRTQSVPLITLDPVTLTKGVAINQVLSSVIDDKIAASGYFDAEIGALFENVPAGLALTFSQGEDKLPILALTGTPTESGEFTADVTFYQTRSVDPEDRIAPDDAIGASPISTAVAITVPTVAEPVVPTTPVTPPVEKAALAATGFDGMILIGFGGLAAGGGILLLASSKRRRA